MHVVISCGDVNGIASDIFFKAFTSHAFHDMQCSIAINEQTANELCDEWNIAFTNGMIHVHGHKINVIPCNHYAMHQAGLPTKDSALLAIESLQISLNMVKSGKADAILTLPISKSSLNDHGWNYSGQTDWLKHEFPESNPIMILFHDSMRIALSTVHIPLKEVSDALTLDRLISTIQGVHQSMKYDFGIPEPRIALLGLNPHAGEEGLLGKEEEQIIKPAIAKVNELGIQCEGPFPADGLFSRPTWKTFDVIIAQYHDQGLIPLKLQAQGHGVNFTANLPIIRVSPDHGTAYSIAGTDAVEDNSMVAAMEAIRIIATNRTKG
jgi:4-hydroxythreonine-4-phosphate dehydrogenase